MSPEITLLCRAVLLGLLVFIVERLSKRRRERQIWEERVVADRTTVRQSPAISVAQPVLEPQFQYVRAVAAQPEHAPLESPSVPACVIERRSVGAYVTEKRSSAAAAERYSRVSPVSWLDTVGLDETGLDKVDARANDTEVDRERGGCPRNPRSYETA